MLYPTINKLTKGKFNRYQLAVATAKCARLITDEYVRERHIAEKAALGVKDADKTADNIVNPDYRDRKAVKIAIDKIESGEYVIVDRDEEGANTPACSPRQRSRRKKRRTRKKVTPDPD